MTQEFVTLPREVVEQALSAIEKAVLWDKDRGFAVPYAVRDPLHAGINTLRAALERHQGEKEPAAEHELKDVRCECCGYMTHHREHMGCIRAAQPKRDPMSTARIDELIEEGIFGGNPYELVRRLEEERCVFMTRPLTDEQIDRIIADLAPVFLDTPTGFEEDFCRAIEAAHNIK